MNFTVYVLYSPTFEHIYIGQTSDLSKRLQHHNDGESKSTKAFRPWKIIHTEVYSTRSEAMKREKQLKSQKGREFIWSIIKHSIPPQDS